MVASLWEAFICRSLSSSCSKFMASSNSMCFSLDTPGGEAGRLSVDCGRWQAISDNNTSHDSFSLSLPHLTKAFVIALVVDGPTPAPIPSPISLH